MSSDLSVIDTVLAAAEYREAIKHPLATDAAIGYALTFLMRTVRGGYSCAVLLDAKRRHMVTISLGRGGKPTDEPMLELIEREVLVRGAAYFALAHCHDGDELRPSRADRAATERIRQRFADSSASLIDHFIISGDSWSTVLSECASFDLAKA